MARPTKQGIHFFSIDVEWDHKIQMFILEQGPTGLAVLLTIWQMIYAEEGYWIKHNDDLALLVKQRIVIDDINLVNVCINSCLCRQIFDEDLYKRFKILTSKAIQKRYFEAASRKREVRFVPEFSLVEVNGYKNLVNVNINSVNACSNATKEKEKEKEKEKVEVLQKPPQQISNNLDPLRKKEWPTFFRLTEGRKKFAIDAGIEDPEKVWTHWKAWVKANGVLKTDWSAAWEAWCLDEKTKKHSTEEGGYG